MKVLKLLTIVLFISFLSCGDTTEPVTTTNVTVQYTTVEIKEVNISTLPKYTIDGEEYVKLTDVVSAANLSKSTSQLKFFFIGDDNFCSLPDDPDRSTYGCNDKICNSCDSSDIDATELSHLYMNATSRNIISDDDTIGKGYLVNNTKTIVARDN